MEHIHQTVHWVVCEVRLKLHNIPEWLVHFFSKFKEIVTHFNPSLVTQAMLTKIQTKKPNLSSVRNVYLLKIQVMSEYYLF